jgi:hypothetical protein
VLERNPRYREEHYAENPPAGDAEAVAMAAALAGRRLPMLDRVEIGIIEEQQPRWLAFLNGEHDFLDRLPNEFAPSPSRTTSWRRTWPSRASAWCASPLVDATFSYFGMENPVVGGYTPDGGLPARDGLAYDVHGEIELVRLGQAVPAQSVIPPLLSGYDPAFKSEMSEHSVPGQGPAGPVRLPRPQRRRLARPARRQPAAAGVLEPARPAVAQAAGAVAQGRRVGQRAHRVQDRQVARAAQGQPRRQADDVGRGLGRRQPRRQPTSWTCCTAPTRARPTTPASTCRSSTALYERRT